MNNRTAHRQSQRSRAARRQAQYIIESMGQCSPDMADAIRTHSEVMQVVGHGRFAYGGDVAKAISVSDLRNAIRHDVIRRDGFVGDAPLRIEMFRCNAI